MATTVAREWTWWHVRTTVVAEPVELQTGADVLVRPGDPEDDPSTADVVRVNFAGLTRALEPGGRLLLADGQRSIVVGISLRMPKPFSQSLEFAASTSSRIVASFHFSSSVRFLVNVHLCRVKEEALTEVASIPL